MEIYTSILIKNKDKVFEVLTCEEVTWETERKGAPGKLTFKVLVDDIVDFTEGNQVSFYVNGQECFCGFVFTKRRDKDNTISVTAYDQLRYLKNKDVFILKNIKASDLTLSLAKDYKLKIGEIQDTGFVIPKRFEDHSTLFDIIQTAIDDTLVNTKKMFVLYDDFGKLMLKAEEEMKVPILIDAETAENFEYESSIDSNVYNRIRLFHDNKKTGKRVIYVAPKDKDDPKYKDAFDKQEEWGVLQLCESFDPKQTPNPQTKANILLSTHSQKSRSLTVSGALGDIRVRAGSSLMVNLHLGDIKVNHWMRTEKATHKFTNNQHAMNLILVGGVINAE